MKLTVLMAGLMFGVAALAADSGAELFQKAVTAERAAGNLEQAITLYQRVATEFASDRALAAKALVQEARCYEKLGQDKAVKIYEQVARDYKDQREPLATANARLAALRPGASSAPATMTQRKIELPPESTLAYKGIKMYVGFLTSPTDGQRVIYKDAATGALMISDLAGQDKRAILKPKVGQQIESIFPLAGSFQHPSVASCRRWPEAGSAQDRRDGLSRISRYLLGMRAAGLVVGFVDLFDCSNNGRAGTLEPDGTSQVRRVSVTDGEVRNLGRAQGPLNRPSPDGRFIASGTRYEGIGKVWIMPIPGGEPELVSENAHLIDWTRDGALPDHYQLPFRFGSALLTSDQGWEGCGGPGLRPLRALFFRFDSWQWRPRLPLQSSWRWGRSLAGVLVDPGEFRAQTAGGEIAAA